MYALTAFTVLKFDYMAFSPSQVEFVRMGSLKEVAESTVLQYINDFFSYQMASSGKLFVSSFMRC